MATQGTTKLPGVQMLRGLAALAVLIHHVLEESQPLFGNRIPAPLVLFGASGVDLFFVISGFIMYYTNRGRLGTVSAPSDFFMRRVVRIVPLYWLCTFVMVAAKAAGFLAGRQIDTCSVLLSLFFLPNDNIVHAVGWTLNYEMYFYAVFTIWLMFGTPRCSLLGVVASIPLITIFSWSLPLGATLDFLGDPIALEFCFGLALGVAFTGRGISADVGRAALVVGGASLVLGTCLGPSNGTTSGLSSDTRFLLWGLPAAVLLISAFSVRQVTHPLGKVLLALGEVSYSIYLTHAFIVTIYGRLLRTHIASGMPRLVLMVIPVIVSLAVGVLTYLYVERPIDRRLKLCWHTISLRGRQSSSQKYS